MLGILTTALSLMSAAGAPSVQRPPLAKVLRGEALESYEGARQDFKSQRFAQALAGFVRAHALSREPRLLWNSAACLRKLERNAEALRILDTYLAQGSDELTPEELEEARRSQAALRELVATVRITTVPGDISVSVDGTVIEAGSVQQIYLEPGRHAFLFSRAGARELVRQEALRARETVAWTIELPPAEAPPTTVTAAPIVAAAPVVAATPTVEAKPLHRPWTPWLIAGGGAVAGAVGGVLLGLSSSDYQRFKQECGTMCSPQRVGPARSSELAGLVLVGVGSAAVATGLGWWLFSGGEVRAQLSLAPAGVSVAGQF